MFLICTIIKVVAHPTFTAPFLPIQRISPRHRPVPPSFVGQCAPCLLLGGMLGLGWGWDGVLLALPFPKSIPKTRRAPTACGGESIIPFSASSPSSSCRCRKCSRRRDDSLKVRGTRHYWWRWYARHHPILGALFLPKICFSLQPTQHFQNFRKGIRWPIRNSLLFSS